MTWPDIINNLLDWQLIAKSIQDAFNSVTVNKDVPGSIVVDTVCNLYTLINIRNRFFSEIQTIIQHFQSAYLSIMMSCVCAIRM